MRIASQIAVLLLLFAWAAKFAQAQQRPPVILPEQRRIAVRDPATLMRLPPLNIPPPPTVTAPRPETAPRWALTLDEAIRIALQNTEVVRVLGGLGGATSSGRTVYDPAISNMVIDERQARFDPVFSINQSFNHLDTPVARFDPNNPGRTLIDGNIRDDYRLDLNLSKTTAEGGVGQLGVTNNSGRSRPGLFPLNPDGRSAVELSYSHPLWQGGGIAVNQVPIVLARIDTERSYFQLKNSLQETVRSVVSAYWALVFARTNVWARQQQVKQGEAAMVRERARKEAGFGNQAQLAQSRLAYASFRANLITANADLLNREATLRNLLGMPPGDPRQLIPLTPPTTVRVTPNWDGILELAAERRPDIIELKLILEADSQLLLQARNQQLPQLDAFALYRWNGIAGEMPIGQVTSSRGGQFDDWTLGINFAVPLGLRQGRAASRRFDLNVARDRAELQQQMHATGHILAANVRNLAQFYAQYQAFRETRDAARENLEQQSEEFLAGTELFLNVLTAITDWGNAVSSEANALLQYNTELANLERETGTILETHGVRLYEERYGAVGPLGYLHPDVCYPRAKRPTSNSPHYEDSEKAAEEFFNLEPPIKPQPDPEEVPMPPRPPRRVPRPGQVPQPGVPGPLSPVPDPPESSSPVPNSPGPNTPPTGPSLTPGNPPTTAVRYR